MLLEIEKNCTVLSNSNLFFELSNFKMSIKPYDYVFKLNVILVCGTYTCSDISLSIN